MTTENELREIILLSFNKLKETFYRSYKNENREDDIHPLVLSRRDMIESLPPSMQVVELIKYENNSQPNKKAFLIKYDFDKLKTNHVEYCGSIDCRQPEKLAELITNRFQIKDKTIVAWTQDICERFSPRAMWDPPNSWYLHLIPHDIISDKESFLKELHHTFFIFPPDLLVKKFERKPHVDYNTIYNIPLEPVLEFEEVVKTDRGASMFGLDLEKIQKAVSDIHLIPPVPDDVKQLFKRAKDLFIFGYFRYEFFTIAEHYAFLALESAIKIRYIKSLDEVAVLTDSKDRKLRHKISMPTYRALDRFCSATKGWHKSRLLVNGEMFPSSGKKLLDWLENRKFIRKWERPTYDAALNIRNILSHQERVSIHNPSATVLQRVSEQINYLFHSQ